MKWNDYQWEEWIPDEIRNQLIGFWAEEWQRSPLTWKQDAEENGAPTHGSIVTLKNMRNKHVTGRFIHAWNNIGRVVLQDGTYEVVAW